MARRPLDDDAFLTAVRLAIRAPSLHNSQPWSFRRDGEIVEVRLDRSRQLPAADPAGRAARIACGAALFNLRVALAVAGRPVVAEVLPEAGDQDLIARVRPGSDRAPTPREQALAAAIPRRRSSRAPFADAAVPLPHQAALTAAAHAESAEFFLATDRTLRADIADLVRAADRALTAEPRYTDELRSWTRPDAMSPDGVPTRAGGPAPAPHELLTRRDFGGALAPESRRYESDPLVGVLGTFGDSPQDQVAGGQALQHVLLTATMLDLAVSILSQPMEVAEYREALEHRLGRVTAPQVILRIGFGLPGPTTPRRPAESVIVAPTPVASSPRHQHT